MESMLRTFIAIELPQPLQKKLDELMHSLLTPQTSAVRWVAAKNIHLTLKFLGDTAAKDLPNLKAVLQEEAFRIAPFEVRVGGLGGFPNLRRPRVIWVGLQAGPSLTLLQRTIDQRTAQMGYASEDRPFSPHLTLGRVNQQAAPEAAQHAGEAVAAYPLGEVGCFTVKDVTLMRSELKSGGSIYTPLLQAHLSNE